LSDSRATILGPQPGWGEVDLRGPAFKCLPLGRRGAEPAFLASAAVHLLLVLALPALLRSLPPDPDEAFRARLRPAGTTALILRMPDRLYLPLWSLSLPGGRAGTRSGGGSGPARVGGKPSGTGGSPVQLSGRARGATVLIQPGKPVAEDIRTLRLPSLLYQARSQVPPPPSPLDPGARERSAALPGIEVAQPSGVLPPQPPVSSRAAALEPITVAPLSPVNPPPPLPRNAASEPQPASGADVSVLSIASSAPRARQVVEIPPVNQLGASGGAQPSGSAQESAVRAARSTAPPPRGGHNGMNEGSAARQGTPVARETPSNSGGPSGNGSPGSLTLAAAPELTRLLRTTLGMVKVLETPSGARQLQYPSGGAFDVVIVESSPGDTVPEADRLLAGRPVHTVFLPLGTGQEWVLQFCLPGTGSASGNSGMVVTLGREPKVESPFILRAFLPPPKAVQSTRPALFHGALGPNGRLVRLRPVTDTRYQPLDELLPYLERWQFRPAKVDGAPAEVEVLLFVPSIARP
jgi:hypothetical protein